MPKHKIKEFTSIRPNASKFFVQWTYLHKWSVMPSSLE